MADPKLSAVPTERDTSPGSCTGCKQAIKDRYHLKILGQPWHVQCVKCHECQGLLNEKCFTRDFKLFCKADFYKVYGTKCQACKEGLCPEDLVRKTVSGVYHVKCFSCSVCKRQLETGEQMYLVQGEKFLCEADYLKSVQAVQFQFVAPSAAAVVQQQATDTSTPAPSTPPVESSLPLVDPASLNGGGGEGGSVDRKRRGSRTTLTPSQLQKLMQVYEYEARPTKETKLALSKATGLDARVIQNWFQNQRSKKRKIDTSSATTSSKPPTEEGSVQEQL